MEHNKSGTLYLQSTSGYTSGPHTNTDSKVWREGYCLSTVKQRLSTLTFHSTVTNPYISPFGVSEILYWSVMEEDSWKTFTVGQQNLVLVRRPELEDFFIT